MMIGFRCFDVGGLLGFVEGTPNPVGPVVDNPITITEQGDSDDIEGSYIVVQKYFCDLSAWEGLLTEQQEAIRSHYAGQIELDGADEDKQKTHKNLTTIVDKTGDEHDILRENMPFGSPKCWRGFDVLHKMFEEAMGDGENARTNVVQGTSRYA